MIIDVHNHYYPPEFIAAIKKGPSKYTVEEDEDGNPVLCSPGDKNFVVPGHRDIAYREGVIESAGVDMQVITLTAPGTTMEEPKQSGVPGEPGQRRPREDQAGTVDAVHVTRDTPVE